MAKVEFDPGIDSVRGILMGTDPTQRAALEEAFKAQSKYTSLFAFTVAQKYVKPNFE